MPSAHPDPIIELDPQFEFVQQLGEGKYGCVFAAKHRSSGQTYAVKKVASIAEKEVLAKRCLREIMLLHHLGSHRNIIGLYKVDLFKFRSGNRDVYLYQDLMETRLDMMIRSQSLTDAHNQALIYQILCGLKYIHSANVVHRDIKPANILVNDKFELKICNFGPAWGYTKGRGNARERLEEAQYRFTDDYIATISYRAPEILLRLDIYSPAIDMWSVGCILGEMMAGKQIIMGKNIDEQLERVVNFLGTPSKATLERMYSESYQTQGPLDKLPPQSPIPLQSFFPQANPLALDLLRQLLSFDPATRITSEQALNHPYFAVLHDPAKERVCMPANFDFEDINDVDAMIGLISEVAQAIKTETYLQPIKAETYFQAFTAAQTGGSSIPKRPDNGAYVLTNVSTGLPIKPEYPSPKSNIICYRDDRSDNFKWGLDHWSNDTYSIKNISSTLFVSCSNNVQPPADALVQVTEHHFNIVPVENRANTFTISTVDSCMYLGLNESVPGAKIVVGPTGTGQLFQWILTKAV